MRRRFTGKRNVFMKVLWLRARQLGHCAVHGRSSFGHDQVRSARERAKKLTW